MLPSWTFAQAPSVLQEFVTSAAIDVVESVRFRPVNAARSLELPPASPVSTLELVVVFAATMLVEPPAAVTAPMTSPATPSPVV